jgi:hypothetical protein
MPRRSSGCLLRNKTSTIAEHTFVKVSELVDGTAQSVLSVVTATEQACTVTIDAMSDATVAATVEVRRAWTFAISVLAVASDVLMSRKTIMRLSGKEPEANRRCGNGRLAPQLPRCG